MLADLGIEILITKPVVETMNRRGLELAALAAADGCLKARGYIAFDEVFREMGKLDAKQWDEWRRGRVRYLERAWATRHVRTQPRSAEINGSATSARDIHGQVPNESGADLDTGFTPTSASESGPIPGMP